MINQIYSTINAIATRLEEVESKIDRNYSLLQLLVNERASTSNQQRPIKDLPVKVASIIELTAMEEKLLLMKMKPTDQSKIEYIDWVIDYD